MLKSGCVVVDLARVTDSLLFKGFLTRLFQVGAKQKNLALDGASVSGRYRLEPLWLFDYAYPKPHSLVRVPNQYLPALGKAEMSVGYGPGRCVRSPGEMAWLSDNEETNVGLFSHLCPRC